MPNSEQIRRFWVKWIDRQYAKADPSHVKMRREISSSREDARTQDDIKTGAAKLERPNNLPPLSTGSKR
jgi:hypothetical protein